MTAPQEEVWRPIPGFEGFYEVSSEGRVRRLAGTPKCVVTRVLRPSLNRGGYPCVDLYVGRRRHKTKVHRLVALAFLGPEPLGHEVNHIDSDRQNPRPSNLEYVTRSGNNRHAFGKGRMPHFGLTGARNPNAVVPPVEEIFAMHRSGMKNTEIVKRLGYRNQKVVTDVLKGRHWSQRRPVLGS